VLFCDRVNPLAAFVLGGFDLDAVLVGRGGEEARTLWACQSVAFMISASVAPLARPIISMIFAPLLSARGAVVFFAGAGLAAFFALASFFGAAGLVLAPLAAVCPLGVPFFWLAALFAAAFSGAPWAPCSATAAASVVVVASVFFMVIFVLIGGRSAHDDSSLRSRIQAREFCRNLRMILGTDRRRRKSRGLA
jgi:hypothetical protein